MKQFITIALAVLALNASAQINLEHSYNGISSFQIINLENEGAKYAMLDTTTKKVMIYNTDHSLWKSINTSIPAGYSFMALSCISEKLFDNDGQIELCFSYYSISPVSYKTLVYKEDGSVITTLLDAYSCLPIKVGNSWKIQASKPSGNDIYSVPGTYSGIMKPTDNGTAETSIFPNPANTVATIRYQLPAGVNEAQLQVYNMNGAMVRSYTVTNQFNDILLQTGELAPGQYVYKIAAPGIQPAAEKFIIQ